MISLYHISLASYEKKNIILHLLLISFLCRIKFSRLYQQLKDTLCIFIIINREYNSAHRLTIQNNKNNLPANVKS